MTVLFDRIEALVAAVETVLVNGSRPMPARIGIYNGGDVAADDCCKGQLYGRWMGSSLKETGGADSEPCGAIYVASIGVGILRCTPLPQGKSSSPTMDKIRTSAIGLHQDADDLITGAAVWGLAVVEPAGESWKVGSLNPLGPEGDCIGVELTLSLEYDARCCEDVAELAEALVEAS